MITCKLTRAFALILLINAFSEISAFGQCNPSPKADFTTRDGCESDSVPFTNASQNAASYEWRFGDGNTSALASPNHLYSYYGNTRTFVVGLYAYSSDRKCADSIYKTVTLYGTSAEFTFSNSGKTYNFTSTGSWISKYYWDFGDGDSAKTANASHTYTDTLSTHKVCLKVTNPMNCSHEKCVQITTLGVRGYNPFPKFHIFPNPNSGNFTIDFGVVKPESTIQIINPVGQLVYQKTLDIHSNILDLILTDGVYWVRILNPGGGYLSQRLIVQK